MPVMGIHFFEPARSIQSPALPPFGSQTNMPEVIVVPAQKEGFENAYLGQNAWWAIRIAAKHRENLKWIAAYQVSPIMAVTHIAEIDHLEPYGDEGKFKVFFKGPAQALPKTIPYGSAPSGAMQGPRYCSKAAFDTAKSVVDLLR